MAGEVEDVIALGVQRMPQVVERRELQEVHPHDAAPLGLVERVLDDLDFLLNV